MSGTHEDRQNIPAMKLMWDEVDARFDPKYVLGEAGHRFCQTYSVRAAQSRIALRSALFVNDVCSGQWGSCCCLSHIPIASDSCGHQCELCPNEKIVHDRPRRNLGASVGCCHPEAVESRLEESLPEPAVQDGLPGGPSGGLRRPGLYIYRHFSSMRCLTLVML